MKGGARAVAAWQFAGRGKVRAPQGRVVANGDTVPQGTDGKCHRDLDRRWSAGAAPKGGATEESGKGEKAG